MTVDAILEAATRILTAEGLAGLNTNAIARKAGVSVGSLYQYFPTKEAILMEMLRRKRRNLLAEMTKASRGLEQLSEDEMIERLVGAAMRNQARAPKLAQALDYANAALSLHEETIHTNHAIMEAVMRFLSLVSIPAREQTAGDIVGLARGMMLQAFRDSPVDEEALLQRICLAIRGYLAEIRKHVNENGGQEPAIRKRAGPKSD